jgi:hypothetical protein
MAQCCATLPRERRELTGGGCLVRGIAIASAA